MLTNSSTTVSCTNQDMQSSNDSNIIQYGPIIVRRCKNVAPTLKTGRRSKYLILEGEEAIRRERRREKNRQTASKLKLKQLMIEEELNQKVKDLENQYLNLQKYVQFLQKRKQLLEDTIDDLFMDSIEKLLA